VKSIRRQAHADTSFGTRKSALETLRKIGKSIVLAPSTLGHEVLKQMQEDATLPEAMLAILASMTVEERLAAAHSADEKGSLLQKMQEFLPPRATTVFGRMR
jgi:hypothetical protein